MHMLKLAVVNAVLSTSKAADFLQAAKVSQLLYSLAVLWNADCLKRDDAGLLRSLFLWVVV